MGLIISQGRTIMRTDDVLIARLEQLMSAYLDNYASPNEHTQRAKTTALRQFGEFLARRHRKQVRTLLLSDITPNDCEAWRMSLSAEGLAPNTINARTTHLKTFLACIQENVQGYRSPALLIRNVLDKRQPAKGFTADESEAIRAAILEPDTTRSPFLAAQESAIGALLDGTALRANEVRCLAMYQLDLENRMLKDVQCKGYILRNVPILEDSIEPLQTYLVLRREEFISRFPTYLRLTKERRREYPVFVTFSKVELGIPDSFRMDPKTLWRKTRRLGERAGVADIHPHQFRHNAAIETLDATGDIRLVSQMLGHGSYSSTMIYTERTDEDLQCKIDQARKRAK